MGERTIILFYSASGRYGCFSNFARYPIHLRGKMWPTSEHFFQAQKFLDNQSQEVVRTARSPFNAAKIGRDRSRKLRLDWESIKVDVMREALRAKFTQHPELADILLSTGDATLVEHTDRDDYWGDGIGGRGKNMLGRLLMALREELHKNAPHDSD